MIYFPTTFQPEFLPDPTNRATEEPDMGLMIPSMLLKQLYTRDSLRNTADGVRFSLKNRLSDSTVTALHGVKIDGVDVPLSAITIDLGDGTQADPCPNRQRSQSIFPCAAASISSAPYPRCPRACTRSRSSLRRSPSAR